MNEKLTVAVIGAGNIAGGFDEKSSNTNAVYTHCGAYSKHGGFVLKSIFDIDIKKGCKFAKVWNVENICDNEALIVKGYHDIISICSPDEFHFQTLKDILNYKSCKTVFVEKPLGLNINEVKEISELSEKCNINIVVNFQRHFDEIYEKLNLKSQKILTVNCFYVKGLKHNGVTMIDTLVMLFGLPEKVYGYNKIHNKLINDFTYEFILFYNKFNITVKTIDEELYYNYHIFDIDILTDSGRLTITDNGNILHKKGINLYDYDCVNVLESDGVKENMGYKKSMLNATNYIYDITMKTNQHTKNMVNDYLNNHIIIEKIIDSYGEQKILDFEEQLWKK